MTQHIELVARIRDYSRGDTDAMLDTAADAIEALEAERDALANSANALDAEATRLSKQITETKGVAVKVMAERDALQAEVERLGAYSKRLEGYNNQLISQRDALQAQLAAARGQEPVCKVGSGWNSGGGFDVYDFQVQPPYGTKLYAAPISQQVAEPSVPKGWKLVPVEAVQEQLRAATQCSSRIKTPSGRDYYRAMVAAAPQPKDMK